MSMTSDATSAPAAPPATAPTGTIAPERARSLSRWNRFLVFAHGGQFVLMLLISGTAVLFEVVVPTARPVLDQNGDITGIEPSSVLLVSFPLVYLIASFFLMSAIAHASAGWLLRGRYEAWLARGMNPLRWVEYSFSSTVMIVAIAYLSFITEFPALVAIAGCNVAMILFGWSMEAGNEGRLTKGERIDWKHFIFGCIAGVVPWIAIFSIVWAYSAQEGLPAEAQIPGFVYVIIASLFVAFNIFAVTMVLQYGKVGRWKDYLAGEKTYMVLSLVAKSLLAWQVWSGTLRPQ
jgi:hypothetical protein